MKGDVLFDEARGFGSVRMGVVPERSLGVHVHTFLTIIYLEVQVVSTDAPHSLSFDDWLFYTGIDANNTGNVYYVTKEFALQERLAFVNEAGRAIIKVDDATDGRGNDTYGRNSVKMLSDWTFFTGDLVLFDAVHMPYGVRPARLLCFVFSVLTSIPSVLCSAPYGPRSGLKALANGPLLAKSTSSKA